MQTRENGFERIMQEVLKQNQLLENLKAENRDLRRQLADLRAGRGMFIDILGQRFSLTVPQDLARSAASETLPAPQVAASENATFTIAHEISVEPHPASPPPSTDVDESEEKTPTEKTQARAKVAGEPVASSAPEVPAVPPPPSAAGTPTGFLEELLLDEFTTATTSQIAIWSGPTTHSDPAAINEEEKAALRRELMGSFLLE